MFIEETVVNEQESNANSALEQQQNAGQQEVETAPTQNEEDTLKEEMYPKQQVIEMMKKRVDRSHNAFFKRYGVANLEELDGLFEKSKKYDEMNSSFSDLTNKNKSLSEEIAFLKNDIDPSRYDDIRTHFKGSNLDFSEEKLIELAKTHPEWVKKQISNPTTIQPISPTKPVERKTSDEEEKLELFKKFGL